MKTKLKKFLIVAACFGLFSSALFAQDMPDMMGWPEASQMAAKDMMEKYGKPDIVSDQMLVWVNNGIWNKTIIFKKEVDHFFPGPHKDVMQQFVGFKVPPDMFDELAEFDGSVVVDRTQGEISARCDKEGANFLALNLAYDIVKGNKSVDEAREFYGKTIMKVKKGEKPEYTQKLMFTPDMSAADPDVRLK